MLQLRSFIVFPSLMAEFMLQLLTQFADTINMIYERDPVFSFLLQH
jgi:hypothetical protein